MSSAGAAAMAAMIQAIRASGVLIKVEPEDFVRIVGKQKDPLIVRAAGGVFNRGHQYMVSYKGFAFYTKSKTELSLPFGAEVIQAKSMYIPG